MDSLRQLLAPSRIALDVPASSWQEAIHSAGDLLERDGHSTAHYTQAMIDSVVDNGPYIVLSPGFAFAHARPSPEVKRTSMSLVRLAAPVEFGHKTNDPVTLVIALAATDNDTHLVAMQQLARIISDPSKRQVLEQSTSVTEIQELFSTAPAPQPSHAAAAGATSDMAMTTTDGTNSDATAVSSKGKLLTVCGNGLGTSLFLKNTLDDVLMRWGWAKYLTVEATDTISAKGKARQVDALLTSGAIAQALGDVGVPVYVIDDFSSATEIDAALRSIYITE